MDFQWYRNEDTGAVFLLSEYQVSEMRREPKSSVFTPISEFEALQVGSGVPENTNPAIDPDEDIEGTESGAEEPESDNLETEDETKEISAELVDLDEAQTAQTAQASKARGRKSASK